MSRAGAGRATKRRRKRKMWLRKGTRTRKRKGMRRRVGIRRMGKKETFIYVLTLINY